MKNEKLLRNFYTRDTLIVAKELLGKYIIRKTEKGKLIGKIIETEAYIGPQDKASHAYKGKRTARNEVEYLTGGHIYIYLVYGMYWQMNITTAEKDQPECVLIRAIEPIINKKLKVQSSKFKTTTQSLELLKNLTNGPGKLCKWLNLDKSFYGEDLTKSKRIWLEDRKADVEPFQIIATGRIGIDYAGPYWSRRKWRFLYKRK